MQIQVIQTTFASKHPCGTKLFLYEAGNVYDIYEDLAEVFLKEGWGEKVEEVKQEIETQEITQEIETQDLKLEKKPRKNANK